MTAQPQRFFFVHMQKTAGTALVQRLRHHFGEPALYPYREDQRLAKAVLDVEFLAERFRAHRDVLRVVTGHFPLCVTEVLEVPFTAFTVLRDPVERTLSFLRHQKKRDPRFRDLALEEIYAEPVRFFGLVRNHMVKMLSLTVAEMTDGTMTRVAFDDDRLERARMNLATQVDVVGLQEHFDEFCAELANRYDWDLGEPRYSNRTEPAEVNGELRELIAHDNAMDVELYRFAVDLLAQRRAERLKGSS